MKKFVAMFACCLVATGVLFANGANEASGKESKDVTVYTAYQEDEAKATFEAFTKETGIQVHFVRLSAGELFTRLQAERENPQVNAVFGISVDTLAAAGKEGLLEQFQPTNLAEIPDNIHDANGYWTAHSISVLCFASNKKWATEHNITLPTSWYDLLKPEFDDQVSLAHPGTSGVAYAVLSGLVTRMGEDEAYDYLKKLDKNIVQYTKGGAAPARMAGLGEAGVGLCWMSDAINTMNGGYELLLSYPKEGSPYEVTGLAVVKNGPAAGTENAKKLIEWAVSKNGQEFFSNNFNRLPANKNAVLTNGATPFDQLNVIPVDHTWSTENKKRLVQRFVDEVRNSDNVLK